MGEFVLWGLDAAARELTLFAAVGFLVGGVDDLLIDLAWLGHRLFGGSPRRALADLPAPPWPRALAVFIPAWDEAAVIGAMLRTALARIGHQRYRLYVGCYPNDPATIAVVTAVAAQDARVRLVIGPRPGPTTKADNLNALWRALRADDDAAGMATRAVVLHDAEQVVPVVRSKSACVRLGLSPKARRHPPPSALVLRPYVGCGRSVARRSNADRACATVRAAKAAAKLVNAGVVAMDKHPPGKALARYD